ncbi:MAG: hypothetical protein P8I55_09870 [Crocinitomix sp.]|nr:hypothetical protein [Crocinitomix sp.]|tara:strand:+ start:81 stop:560 length:480 start_codon:yes stop_codon:yes gene_type:complete
MKNNKGLNRGIEWMLMLFVMGIFMSCAASSSTEEPDSEEAISETEPIDLVEDYGESSWQEFKAAVKSKDEAKLQMCCTPEITDFEALFFMLNELYVMRKMDETQHSDLESVMVDGKEYLQFYAEEIGEDEYGYETATSITLHFLVVEGSLFLDHYLAAG